MRPANTTEFCSTTKGDVNSLLRRDKHGFRLCERSLSNCKCFLQVYDAEMSLFSRFFQKPEMMDSNNTSITTEKKSMNLIWYSSTPLMYLFHGRKHVDLSHECRLLIWVL